MGELTPAVAMNPLSGFSLRYNSRPRYRSVRA